MSDLAEEIYEGMKRERLLPKGYHPLWSYLDPEARAPFERTAAAYERRKAAADVRA